MSNLAEAIYDKMAEIVFHEHKPFWSGDFTKKIEIDGKTMYPAYGTIRNIFWKLRKEGKIVFCYNSGGIAFHTFPGMPFSNKTPMTNPHTRTRKADWIFETVSGLKQHKHALHDIRLHFKAKGIYELLLRDKTLMPNPQSKDIQLDPFFFEPGKVKYTLTVHHTDTVSLMVACDLHPIAVDLCSIRSLTEDLTRVEERLTQRLLNVAQLEGMPYNISIPRHVKWIVTMWHYGADGSVEYNGEAFHMTFDNGMTGLERVYVKDMRNSKQILRHELQEYPDKNLEDALEERLTFD